MDLIKAPQKPLLLNHHQSSMKDNTSDKKNNVSMTTTVIVAIVALIIGFVGGWMVGDKGAPAQSENTPATQNTTTPTGGVGIVIGDSSSALNSGSSMSAPSVAAITVDNQKAGAAVLVSLVSSDASAWLAVRENNNGLVGNILGAKRIDVGTSGNVEIPLLRSTEAGKSSYVVLFKDNGDRMFDFKTDPPMTADGVFISKMFSAQ